MEEPDSYQELCAAVLANEATMRRHVSRDSLPSMASTPDSPIIQRFGCSPLPAVLLERNPATGALFVEWCTRDADDIDTSTSESNDDAANDNSETSVISLLEKPEHLKLAKLCNAAAPLNSARDAFQDAWERETSLLELGLLRRVQKWERQTRRENSNRLKEAAAKASDSAALKMLALATNEKLRAGELPITEQQSINEPRTVNLADIRVNTHDAPHDRLMLAALAPAVVDSSCFQWKRNGATAMVQRRSHATVKELPSWACLVTGFHALLGCDGALRA
jgi:hypothetical protein